MSVVNIKKISLLIFCLIGFSSPSFADTTPDGQPILYCPQAVECDLITTERCHVANNQYDMWGIPTYGGSRLLKGTYKLKEVTLDSYTKRPICRYYLDDKQPAPVEVTIKNGGMYNSTYIDNYMNSFNAFQTESTQWIKRNSNATCFSDNPMLCPMVEVPEITVTTIGQSYNMRFYFPSGDDSGWGANFVSMSILSYEELHKRCGATSTCIIEIGCCDAEGYMCGLHGTVSLDISNPNIVKIDKITTLNSYTTLKKKEPFNTLYFPVKNGNI